MLGGVPLCPAHLDAVLGSAPSGPRGPSMSVLTPAHVVYYVTWDNVDFLKIGTTQNLDRRLMDLRRTMNEESRQGGPAGRTILLATEPGYFDLEAYRHKQFAHLRINGRNEYFRWATDIYSHIDGLPERRRTPRFTPPHLRDGSGDPLSVAARRMMAQRASRPAS